MLNGDLIRELRLKKKMTQSDLAELVGVKFSAIHKYESGKVVNLPTERLLRLADALGTTPVKLMGWSNFDSALFRLNYSVTEHPDGSRTVVDEFHPERYVIYDKETWDAMRAANDTVKVDTDLSGANAADAGAMELTEYLEMLRTRPECRMLFSLTKDATKEDVEKAVAIITALRSTEGK